MMQEQVVTRRHFLHRCQAKLAISYLWEACSTSEHARCSLRQLCSRYGIYAILKT